MVIQIFKDFDVSSFSRPSTSIGVPGTTMDMKILEHFEVTMSAAQAQDQLSQGQPLS